MSRVWDKVYNTNQWRLNVQIICTVNCWWRWSDSLRWSLLSLAIVWHWNTYINNSHCTVHFKTPSRLSSGTIQHCTYITVLTIHFKHSYICIVNLFTTKILSVAVSHTFNHSERCHQNSLTTFWVILFTEKHRDKTETGQTVTHSSPYVMSHCPHKTLIACVNDSSLSRIQTTCIAQRTPAYSIS